MLRLIDVAIARGARTLYRNVSLIAPPGERIGLVGANGMTVVKKLARQARGHLKRGGLLFVEVGDGRREVERVLADVPLTWLTTSAGDDMVFMARQEELP